MKKIVLAAILLGILSVASQASEWTGTWSTSVYSDSQLNTNLDNMTLRQVVRVSIPGEQIRLSFSNLFGSTPLVIQKVHLAQSTGGHTINTGTDLTVTFSGSESITIPAGGRVTSDTLAYSLPALTNMTITLYLGDVPATVSGHVGSRTTSYWQSGDYVTSSSLPSPSSDTHWYVIDSIDVYREDAARAVSCMGDSITDGYGTTTDAQNRWTDFLATRLQGTPETSDVGVLNAGIGATLVVYSGTSRLQRDVIDQADVKYLLLLYGVNDIGGSTPVSSILSEYQAIIANAHSNGILVYGGTITPFGGSGYYSATNESERQQVNDWIRNTSTAAGGFDAVIDFDAALRDPSDYTQLLPAYSNDGLHPSIAGYEAMADAINLALFSLDETPPAVPTGLTAATQSYKQIDLDWNDNSDDDFSHYNVWRSTNSGGTYSEIATVTESYFNDVNPEDRLSPSTPYFYVVTAVDNTGNESANSAQVQDTTGPLPTEADPPTPTPAMWKSVPAASGTTVITMTAVTGDDPHGPVEYLFTCTDGGGHSSDWQLSPSYTDSDLTSATQYTYTVTMRDDLGNVGTASDPASATTFEGPGEFQESGGIVSMEAENGAVGNYGWITVDNAGASNGQYIENTVDYTGTGAPECTSADCIASYDFNITTGGNYRFWFRTYSNSYNDDSLFWRIDNGLWMFENGRSGIGLWFATDDTQVDTLSVGSHTLEIGYREDGTILDKFVIQLDAMPDPTGDGPPESAQLQGSNENPPLAPTGLSATISGAQIDLAWSPSTGATGYNVKRSTTSGGPYVIIEPNINANSYSDAAIEEGIVYYYVVSALNAYGESPDSQEVFPKWPGTGQTPYPGANPHAIPGLIEVENYDSDGEGISFHDIDSTNEGGAYRSDGVDIEVCGEGGYNVGWIANGEWLEYTVSVAAAGTYNIEVRVASESSGGFFHIEFDDTDVTGAVSFAATGAWQTYESVFVNDVLLTEGDHIMRVAMDADGFNVNWLDFTLQAVLDPNLPVLLAPSDGLTNVSKVPTLQWTSPSAYTPDHYEVYLGTNPVVTQNPVYSVSAEEYTPAAELKIDTTYYWTVIAYDGLTPYPCEEVRSFTTLKPRDRVLGNLMLINDNAGWCWYQDDKIIYDPVGGNVITSTTADARGFGGIGGSRDGETEATTFNIASGQRTRVLARDSYGDDHNMGALWIRPDGKYLHVYCDHYNDWISYFRISTNPNDGSSWDSQQTYNWLTIPGSPGTDTQNSSYTNVHYVASEDRLYNIIRIFNRTPCISYSDDWGQTWNYMGRLNDVTVPGYSNFYHKFRVSGDKIHFIGCEAHPRDFDDNSIYHGYIQNGISYDSYGNQIDVINDQDAPAIGAFTQIWDSGPVSANDYHTGWTNEIEIDENGYPVCLFQSRYGTGVYGGEAGATDHRFFYGRFDGEQWTYTELAKMGSGLNSLEQDYLGMGCIHPDNVNIIYISTPFDPRDDTPLEHHEIFKGVTNDMGLTWNWTQITFDSTEDNIRPAIPQWDANNTALFWARGEYPIQNEYDFVLVGMVDEAGRALTPVTYIDATASNTTEADDSAFTPTGPSDMEGASDSQWHEYTGYGNGGSCYTAGDGGTEDAPAIKTTLSNLEDGTYDVFAFFWGDPDLNWGIRGGLSVSEMLCFSKQSSQSVPASDFSGPVEVENGQYLLYRVYMGRRVVSGGASIDVYIDNYDGSYSGDVPSRTTYDGVGVAKVIPDYDGDIDRDGKVNLVDLAELSQGWQDVYNMDTLKDIAADWLLGCY